MPIVINIPCDKPKLRRCDIEREIKRVKNLSTNYKNSKEDIAYNNKYLKQLYSELDKFATKKECKEANS